MKEFHVYGIGNALLDIDIEVNASILDKLNIEKGVMTLIDEERHHLLLKELHGIEHLKACGGSAANTLYTLQQLGGRTFYSCKIGKDSAGDFFYQNLMSYGIKTNITESLREGVTGKCIVLVTEDADRTMNTFLGATATFSKAQLSEEALKQAEYLYIEGYLAASPLGREAAICAREMAHNEGIKTAITLSDPNMVTYFKEDLCRMMGHKVDLLFCNEREALLFSESERLQDAQEKLKDYANTFVVTRGEQGALLYDGKAMINIDAYPAKVLDTVGAGDVFAGTFFFGITHGFTYQDSADLANYAAAKVVGKYGPRLSQHEIDDVRKTTIKQAV